MTHPVSSRIVFLSTPDCAIESARRDFWPNTFHSSWTSRTGGEGTRVDILGNVASVRTVRGGQKEEIQC